MVTVLSFIVILLLCIIYYACIHIAHLEDSIDFWRQEAMRLNSELPKRDSKGRFCKKQ
jgi:hypothetical protein